MSKNSSLRPVWLVMILLLCLGAKGCPTTVGCGVSGSLSTSPRGFSADTWNCQVGLQFAKGVSVSTPQQAKTELLAKKDQAAIQVASLKDQMKGGGDQAFGFGGKETDGRSEPLDHQLQAATRDLDLVTTQIGSLDQLQPPPGTTVLSEGGWSMEGEKAVFRTQTPYDPAKKYVIPYVARSAQGEIVEMGYLPVESVHVQPAP